MSTRERLLSTLRAQSLPRVPLPELSGSWVQYPDLPAQFCAALGRAAGNAVLVDGELASTLRGLPVVTQARRTCSLLPGFEGTVSAAAKPHDYRDVDLLLAPAEFGVAESGALWIDERTVPVRAGLFLTQHLLLVLPRTELVPHLHAAYERLGSRVGQTGYAGFICGPSKTADIEQALVVGAHGPRSLTVLLT
ncbi:MAG: Lactate utilization protein [Pseudomonadota bacterium]